MEKIILNLLLLNSNKEILNKILELDNKFLSKHGKKLFNILKKSQLENGVVNFNSEIPEMQDKRFAQFTMEVIQSNSNAESLEQYVEKLKTEYFLRKTQEISKLNTKSEILTAIDELKTDIMENDKTKMNILSLKDLSMAYFEDLDKETDVINTKNWKLFNKIVSFEREDMSIIGARPGMGKTAFALALTTEFAENDKKGIFISLEMSEKQLYKRLLAQTAELPINLISTSEGHMQLKEVGHLQIARATEKLHKFHDKLSIVSGNMSVADIRNYCLVQKEVFGGLDYIIIDYLQLISGPSNKSRYEQITEISISLKKLAKELGIAVIALAQLSRTVEQRADKTPTLSDLRDSGQIEQDASIVIGLLRQHYYDDEASPNILEVHVLKNRAGELSRMKFHCELDKMIVRENMWNGKNKS